ncbi:hypothetical protein DPEC_G00235750 [Dallia pectoralis]|uniref:Uncharacterized protein n=1 Tax=Dallia pectoralis TaxID=75939 RepID=A0ACC2FXZ6_DALPE|nr:hypothetical protein DPEC_G00235750 [Dallia pectoralis]
MLLVVGRRHRGMPALRVWPTAPLQVVALLLAKSERQELVGHGLGPFPSTTDRLPVLIAVMLRLVMLKI